MTRTFSWARSELSRAFFRTAPFLTDWKSTSVDPLNDTVREGTAIADALATLRSTDDSRNVLE